MKHFDLYPKNQIDYASCYDTEEQRLLQSTPRHSIRERRSQARTDNVLR